MRGRGEAVGERRRTRSNWRSGASNAAAATAQNEVPPPESFAPPEIPDTSTMEFYSHGLPETAADVPGSDSDASMQEGDMQEAPTRKRPWEKAGGGKNRMKKKKVPGAKNLKIRRYVQPKNAVMCLNELRPGVAYTTEQEGGVNQPYCISVEIPNGSETQKFRGFGSSKQLAKQAAAEAALISFVKPPVTECPEDDKTPWATLASFAIYKLFNDWREGRVGMCPPPAAQAYGTALPPELTASDATGFQAFLGQTLGGAAGIKDESAQGSAFTEAIAAHLGARVLTPTAEPREANLALQSQSQAAADGMKVPKPAKQMPENAAAMHPVMVLHQMKPGVQYNITQATKENRPSFTVTVDLDGKTFTGIGPNVKKAKFHLAKEAIQVLYGIESTFECPA